MSYVVEWRNTPGIIAEAMAYSYITVMYVDDGADGEPCFKTMDNKPPDHNIDFGNDVKRDLPDPMLETAEKKIHTFQKEIRWSLAQAMMVRMSALPLAMRDINVDPMLFL